MASVFFMQPLGQIAGNLVSLIVIAVSRSSNDNDITRSMDSAWRWVLGIGVVPGLIATILRFAIPESPRYVVEIEDDPITAEFDATTLFSEPSMSPAFETASLATGGSTIQLPPISSIASYSSHEDDEHNGHLPPATLNTHWRLARTDIVRYFWTEGNWRALAGTSLAWLLLDFGFYGIGLSSPQFLAKTWGALHTTGAAPNWMTDSRPGASVYDMFFDTSVRGLIVLNIGSFAGCLLFILFANRIDRVALQKFMFLALTALFIALGCIFITLTTSPPAVVTLYILGQFLFNFGTYLPHPYHHPTNNPANTNRPKRNNIHDPRRNLSNTVPRNLPWPQRGRGQIRLNPRPSLLDVLPLRRRFRSSSIPPPWHCSLCFQRLHGYRSCGHSFLDSARPTTEWT